MKQSGHARYYDRLTPEERFRLDVLAMARGDTEESDLLTRTCPKREYIMNDVQFAGRWDGAIQLAMTALMDLRPAVAKLRMIEVSRVVGPYLQIAWKNDLYRAYFNGHEAGSRYAWSKAGKEGEPPGWEAGEDLHEENAVPQMDEDLEKLEASLGNSDALIAERLKDIERDLAANAQAGWQAFEGFCEEQIGLDAKKLLTATLKPALEDVAYFEEACELLEVEADPAAIEECREVLGQHWPRILTQGGVAPKKPFASKLQSLHLNYKGLQGTKVARSVQDKWPKVLMTALLFGGSFALQPAWGGEEGGAAPPFTGRGTRLSFSLPPGPH